MDEGDINEIAKIHWRDDCPHLKIFSRTIGSISTKLGIKHPWVQGNSIFTKIQKEMINFLIINVYSPSFVRIYSLIGIVCKISISKKGAIGVGIHGESTIHNR